MELMKTTSSFFAKIRQKLFNWRLEWEIYNQIFSHLNREKQHDYPFESREELLEVVIRGNHRITHEIAAIEQQAGVRGAVVGVIELERGERINPEVTNARRFIAGRKSEIRRIVPL